MHVAVTGASSGIGEAVVREYAGAGAAVTLVARRRDKLKEIAKEAGGRTFVFPLDLSDVARATDWIQPAEKELGPIDVLVNNAGVQIVEPADATPWERIEEMIRIDLISSLKITRTVLPGMMARRSGTIVEVSSMAAIAPTPGMCYYNAAKAGQAAFSESLRGELRGTGVHVVTVYPGPVDTPMGRAGYASYEPSWQQKVLPAGQPEELARLIRRAVSRRTQRIIYPRSYALSRHFPAITRWVMDRMTPQVKRPPAR